MKLSVDEVRLLRSLVEWRRAEGWTLGRFDYTYVSPDRKTEFWPGWGEDLGDHMLIGYPDPQPGWPRERKVPQCMSVREAVDVLCALQVLPARFSSQYTMGQMSAAIQVVAEVGTAAAQRESMLVQAQRLALEAGEKAARAADAVADRRQGGVLRDPREVGERQQYEAVTE